MPKRYRKRYTHFGKTQDECKGEKYVVSPNADKPAKIS